MNSFHERIKNHWHVVKAHVKKHHKKYVWWFFAGFAVVKMILLISGLVIWWFWVKDNLSYALDNYLVEYWIDPMCPVKQDACGNQEYSIECPNVFENDDIRYIYSWWTYRIQASWCAMYNDSFYPYQICETGCYRTYSKISSGICTSWTIWLNPYYNYVPSYYHIRFQYPWWQEFLQGYWNSYYWHHLNLNYLTGITLSWFYVITWDYSTDGNFYDHFNKWYSTSYLDNQAAILTITPATWYECQTITWSILVNNEWCSSTMDYYDCNPSNMACLCQKWDIIDPNPWIIKEGEEKWDWEEKWWWAKAPAGGGDAGVSSPCSVNDGWSIYYSSGKNSPWTSSKTYRFEDSVWNVSSATINYTWLNSGITIGTSNVNLWIITGNHMIPNLINYFGAKDWDCGASTVSVQSINCVWWSGILQNWNLTIIPDTGAIYSNRYCDITFKDDENYTVSWRVVFATQTCNPDWDNRNFLTGRFWSLNPTDEQIICALYGSGGGNTTAYTKQWKDNNCNISNMRVNRVSSLPTTLSGHTIYVLDSNITKNSCYQIDMDSCSAIVSSDGIFMRWIEIDSHINNIIDNIKILWEILCDNWMKIKWWNISINNISVWKTNKYWIFIDSTRYLIVNNTKSYNNQYGIYLESSLKNTFNNIQTYNNTIDWIYLENSTENTFNNMQIYNNDEIGANLIGSKSNILNNIYYYNNGKALKFEGSDSNIFNNSYIFNNTTVYEWDLEWNMYCGILNVIGNINGNGVWGISQWEGDCKKQWNMNTWGPGVLTEDWSVNWNLMTNPLGTNNQYLLNWKVENFADLIWNHNFGYDSWYSYGVHIMTQEMPILYVGDNLEYWSNNTFAPNYIDTDQYIWSDIDKVAVTMSISPSLTSGNTTVNINANSTNYNIFGHITNEKIGINNNTSTGIVLDWDDGNKTIIWQVYTPGSYFASHTETLATKDATAPTVTLSWGAVSCLTWEWLWVVTWTFSEHVIWVVTWSLSVINWTVQSFSTMTNNKYKWIVTGNSLSGTMTAQIATWTVTDDAWNPNKWSNKVTKSFDMQVPEFTVNRLVTWYECQDLTTTVNVILNDGCASNSTGNYQYGWWIWAGYSGNNSYTTWLNYSWSDDITVYIKNIINGNTSSTGITFEAYDSNPSISTPSIDWPDYGYDIITWSIILENLIDTMWVEDWDCGQSTIVLTGISCYTKNSDYPFAWTWYSVYGNSWVAIDPPYGVWAISCTITFQDDEWNIVTWTLWWQYNVAWPECHPFWDNDNFLDENFWHDYSEDLHYNEDPDYTWTIPTNENIICALYGERSEGVDKTAYTKGWSDFCEITDMTVEYVSNPHDLSGNPNTVYVLTGPIELESSVEMDSCSAIISKEWYTLTMSWDTNLRKEEVIDIRNNLIILDNFSINWVYTGADFVCSGNEAAQSDDCIPLTLNW